MEIIGIALISFFTIFGFGIASQSTLDFPQENVQLNRTQAQAIATHLSGYVEDQFPPEKTMFKLVHKDSPLSTQIEQTLRNKGYAIVSDKRIKVDPKMTYATDYIDENHIVIKLDIGETFDLTGSYMINKTNVTPIVPFTIKTND